VIQEKGPLIADLHPVVDNAQIAEAEDLVVRQGNDARDLEQGQLGLDTEVSPQARTGGLHPHPF